MSKQLPLNPSLEYDKKQSKALLKAYQAGDADALARVRESHPRLQNVPERTIPLEEFKLSDAQLVIAREYGFSSWSQLKHQIEIVKAGLEQSFSRFADAVSLGDGVQVRKLLEAAPALAKRINDPVIGFDAPAIVVAAGCGNQELIDVLLEYGADVNAKSVWWAGAFGVLHNTDSNLAKHLIAHGAKIDAHAASEHGMLDVLHALVDADPAVVHSQGPDGQRPLHFARSIPTIDFLIERGADIDALDVDHRATAAQWMIGEYPELTRYLITRGSDTDIFMACALGDSDLMRNLIDAEPNVVNMRIGQKDYTRVPPAPGLHIYAYTFGDNKSPHQIAQDFGHDAVYQLLLERSSTQRRFIAACERVDAVVARALLKDSPSIADAMPSQDQRLLADAAWENDIEAVRLLLDLGFDTHVRGANESTPLHRAAFHGFSEVVHLLLQHNPPLTLQNQYGARPLDSAIYGAVHSWRHDGDFPKTVEMLINAGSKISADSFPTGNEDIDVVLRRYIEQDTKQR